MAWLLVAPPLPVVMLLIIGLLLYRLNQADDLETAANLISFLLLSFFSFLMCGKILFKVTFKYYSAFLAMPATLTLIIFCMYNLPKLMDSI